MKFFSFFCLVLCLSACQSRNDSVILYTFPAEAPKSESYNVLINDVDYYVYPAPVADIVNFGIKGEVRIAVTPSVRINSVDIRPKSAKVKYEVDDNTIFITLSKPQFLSVEVNGDTKRPLLLFANAPETDIPDRNNPDVLFFEAGKMYDTGRFEVKSNQTVYFAPGSIVLGSIISDHTENVRVLGRGMLSGANFQKGESRMIELDRVKNVTVEGITIIDCKHWTMPLMGCDNVLIKDVKIVTGNDWDDGVDVVGSRNVTIDGCFIRTKDDCIAIKAGITYFTDFDTQFVVDNVTVKNCICWNAEWGNGLEIGFETRADTIKNVVFENIDMIHVEGNPVMDEATFTIHNGDRAVVENILYKNIRVEDPEILLVDFQIMESKYSKDTTRGKIANVRMEDITVTTKEPVRSKLIGFDENSDIRNVYIKNMTINGKKILSPEDMNLSEEFVTDVRFE
ncbi:MAG: glycosyl hydrolase family 28 protein [Bacteroidales bacterium]|nr:glycosyl hydrolase family 28 protein [Bacteroidales bacterium]